MTPISDSDVERFRDTLMVLHDGPATTQVSVTESSVRAALEDFERRGWVKCSERNPMCMPYSSRVLIAYHYESTPENVAVNVAWLMDGEWRMESTHIKSSLLKEGFIVTHWRPLPLPPGQEGEG